MVEGHRANRGDRAARMKRRGEVWSETKGWGKGGASGGMVRRGPMQERAKRRRLYNKEQWYKLQTKVNKTFFEAYI